MPPRQPRIRMFAGPNGSGKSTVKDYLLPQHIGAYLNADELEQNLRQSQRIDLLHYHPSLKASELVTFLKSKKRPQAGQFVALLAHEPIVQMNGRSSLKPMKSILISVHALLIISGLSFCA